MAKDEQDLFLGSVDIYAPEQNDEISSENQAGGRDVSRYVDPEARVCSRNFAVLAGERLFFFLFSRRICQHYLALFLSKTFKRF